jgi:hypothetical protein
MNEVQLAYLTTLSYELNRDKDEKYIELQKEIDEAKGKMVKYLATHLPEELK